MNTGPVRILDSQVKNLRGKEIRTVKVVTSWSYKSSLGWDYSRDDLGDGGSHEV